MKDPILRLLRLRPPLSEDALDLVIRHLRLFIAAGGLVDWDLWRRLTPETRAALVEAAEEIAAERAAAVGLASQGRREAAKVLSVSDGGDLDTRVCLDAFIDRLDLRHAAAAAKQRTQ